MGIRLQVKPASLRIGIPIVQTVHFFGLLQNLSSSWSPFQNEKDITNLIALKLFLVCKMDFNASVWDLFLLNMSLCYG